MLININQSSAGLLSVIQKYGCYFLCFAEASPIIFEGESGCQRLNGIWMKATEKGIISDDLNHDGDYDDDGEAEIQNPESLARQFFNLRVKYDGIHHNACEVIPSGVKLIIGQYYYKGGHFVIINRKKKVTFDSYGISNAVRYGYLKTMRFFYSD